MTKLKQIILNPLNNEYVLNKGFKKVGFQGKEKTSFTIDSNTYIIGKTQSLSYSNFDNSNHNIKLVKGKELIIDIME